MPSKLTQLHETFAGDEIWIDFTGNSCKRNNISCSLEPFLVKSGEFSKSEDRVSREFFVEFWTSGKHQHHKRIRLESENSVHFHFCPKHAREEGVGE
jgi:hypothetical protein